MTDQFRPTDKWLINAGIRLDSYGFVGQNTLDPPLGGSAAARAFWFNAYNLDNCVNNRPVRFRTRIRVPGADVSRRVRTPRTFRTSRRRPIRSTSSSRASAERTPRIPTTSSASRTGGTREAPNTAFEQYNTRQEDLADYIGSHFLAFGRNTPGYPIQPPTSINYDLSWEHRFKDTDLSFKLTPFLRQTQNQIQQFFLDPIQGFVSGLNVGSQRSEGVEFQMQKGDFSRDGISGLLSFAYTNSYIHYGPIAAGASGSDGAWADQQLDRAIQRLHEVLREPSELDPNTMCGGSTSNGCNRPTPATTATERRSARCRAAAVRRTDRQSVLELSRRKRWSIPAQTFPTFDTFPGAWV